MKNCLNCRRWSKCKDPKKSAGYICSKYKALKNRASFDSVERSVEDVDVSEFEKSSKLQEFEDMIDEVLNNPTPTPKDLRVDDSSVPVMKNFYEFCFDSEYGFSGNVPFARQLWIGLMLFNEICPRCTKKKYFSIYNIPVGLKHYKLQNKITLLEHGKCPKCSATRTELIENKEIELYTELAHLSGQRCVTADTYVLTDNGIEQVEDIIPGNLPYGFSNFSALLHNGESIEKTLSCYASKPEPVTVVTTELGNTLSGTYDHPVDTEQGFKELSELQAGDTVAITYNTQVFGNQEITEKDPESYAYVLQLAKAPKTLQIQWLKERFGLPGDAKYPYSYFFIELVLELNKGVAYLTQQILFNLGIVSSVSEQFESKCTVTINKESLDRLAVLFNPEYETIDNAQKPLEGLQVINVKVTNVVEKGKQPTYDFQLHDQTQFLTNGFLSHNSGKNIAASFYAAYVTHRVLKLQKPADLYLGVDNQYIVGSFTSLKFPNTLRELWIPFTLTLDASKWFEKYHELLKEYESSLGVKLYKRMDTFIDYRHRKVLLLPEVAHTGKLRGKSRFYFVIDEIAFFTGDEENITISGNGIFEALNASMLTVRVSAWDLIQDGYYDIPTAVSLVVSSPRDQNDMIMQMTKFPKVGRLAIHTATWDINPKVPRDHPEIVKEYEKNPVLAERNFGANPPLSGSPFIENINKVIPFFAKTKNRISIEYAHLKTDNELLSRYAKVTKANTVGAQFTTVMALDGGATDNAFSAVIGHKESAENIVVDAIIDIIPEKGTHILNYPLIYENVLEPIFKKFNVSVVLADRWQSLFLLQKAFNDYKQIHTSKTYSVKYKDFAHFKSFLLGGVFTFPALEQDSDFAINFEGEYPHVFDYNPVSHLLHQMLTVQDTGKSVVKGLKRTDDIFRALVLFSSYMIDPKNNSTLLKKTANSNRAVVATGAGGSASNVVAGR